MGIGVYILQFNIKIVCKYAVKSHIETSDVRNNIIL
jgi:hypothetical protein